MPFSIMEMSLPHYQLVIIGHWKTKLRGSHPHAVSVQRAARKEIEGRFFNEWPRDQTIVWNTHRHRVIYLDT